MRIVLHEPLRDFAAKHPQANEPLAAWYRRVRHAEWKNPVAVKHDYGTADILANNRIVFKIGGNNYRLIARLNYHRQALYIRFIGTHAEDNHIDAITI